MPAILDPSAAAVATWLDPCRTSWSHDLQALLRPSAADLEVYSVSKEVGKVGNDSPSFVIPVASKENKENIANFFANSRGKGPFTTRRGAERERAGNGGLGMAKKEEADTSSAGVKREASPADKAAQPPSKVLAPSPRKSTTRNGSKAPVSQGKGGSQKITKFFTKAE